MYENIKITKEEMLLRGFFNIFSWRTRRNG